MYIPKSLNAKAKGQKPMANPKQKQKAKANAKAVDGKTTALSY
jgi:hypothetical protein